MKFSERTLTILKNFATINPSVIFKPGTVIRTISPQKTVIAIATIQDEIPANACIYDMSRFLSIYGLYANPEIQFEPQNFIINEGKRKTKYVFASVEMVLAPPEKDMQLPTTDIDVELEWADLQSVIKAAGVLQLPEIAFVGQGGVCYLRAINSSNPTADTFGIELGETDDTFQLIIKTDNLKLLPQKYHVTVSSKGISCFEASDIKYFIAVDSKSTYKKGTK